MGTREEEGKRCKKAIDQRRQQAKVGGRGSRKEGVGRHEHQQWADLITVVVRVETGEEEGRKKPRSVVVVVIHQYYCRPVATRWRRAGGGREE